MQTDSTFLLQRLNIGELKHVNEKKMKGTYMKRKKIKIFEITSHATCFQKGSELL